MIFFKLFLLFVFFSACTHAPVRVVLGDCQTKAVLAATGGEENIFRVEKEYWSRIETPEILLSDILEEESYLCDDVSRLDWELSQNSRDVLISLLPMLSRGRIILYYQIDQ